MITATKKRSGAIALSKAVTAIIQGSNEIASATFNINYDHQETVDDLEGYITREPTGWMNVDIKIRCKTLADKTPEKRKD